MNPFIELNRNRLGKNNTMLAGRRYLLPDLKAERPDTSGAGQGKSMAEGDSMKVSSSGSKKESESPEQKKENPVDSKPADSGSGVSVSRGTGKIVRHEIFGKKYENVEIHGDELKGAVYYLVAGHGGQDPGAVGKYENHMLCEDEYAYDVTLRLARNLIQHSATVYMITRDPNDGIRDDRILKPDKDEKGYPNLTIPLNQARRLKQRTDAVNSLYGKHKNAFQRMIAVHVDSRSHGENIDVFFYHDKRSNTGEKAARIMQRTFQEKYDMHQPGRGYKGTVSNRSLYVVKNTFPVAIYVELGNINHHRDQQRFVISDNRQALANWMTQALRIDFKTNK